MRPLGGGLSWQSGAPAMRWEGGPGRPRGVPRPHAGRGQGSALPGLRLLSGLTTKQPTNHAWFKVIILNYIRGIFKYH